jgi:hypothetical protein
MQQLDHQQGCEKWLGLIWELSHHRWAPQGWMTWYAGSVIMLVTSGETVARGWTKRSTTIQEMSKSQWKGDVSVITLIPSFYVNVLAKGSDDSLITEGWRFTSRPPHRYTHTYSPLRLTWILTLTSPFCPLHLYDAVVFITSKRKYKKKKEFTYIAYVVHNNSKDCKNLCNGLAYSANSPIWLILNSVTFSSI